MGEDSNGKVYQSVQEFWDKISDNKEDWYSKSLSHWEKQKPTDDGVLQGFGELSSPDLDGSLEFLRRISFNEILAERKDTLEWEYALDCGAGIGRVTKGCLLKKFSKVDLIEPVAKYIEEAKENVKGTRFFNEPLQTFVPEESCYDCIWAQWSLLYLTDEDLLKFLLKCRLALKPGGIIVVKENVTSNDAGFFVDTEDNSITRTDQRLRSLFTGAGFRVALSMKQPNFPKKLLGVIMYCLTP